jgi:predicted metal-dependent HD superfamily phosphohydrolase
MVTDNEQKIALLNDCLKDTNDLFKELVLTYNAQVRKYGQVMPMSALVMQISRLITELSNDSRDAIQIWLQSIIGYSMGGKIE